MKFIYLIFIFLSLTSCWPTSVSFQDKGSMPEEWKYFSVKTLEALAPNAPLSYAPNLSEDLKDGIQNNTRLKLAGKAADAEVQIEGNVTNYLITPIALQAGDIAAKNRLTISTNYTIYIKKPKAEEMKVSSSRFADYDSNSDFNSVETALIAEINKQIVQDVINKLLSNW